MQRLKNSQTELEKLKELLLADELEKLKKLESKVETLDFEAKDDATIMKRVTPAISKGIADNKETMIDALYPIMGGMISKYVTQAIKEMMETINKKIEEGFSFERYKRKAKAKLTGVSETELLIEESANATISSMFVIHKETSLLIAEAHLENKEIDDAHMVASMASAIKDFVNDWIQNNEAGDEVQILSYGNATLYIESAGSVFMIAFLDTEPDYEQRGEINTFFGTLIKEYSDFFQRFDGNDNAEEIVTLSKKMKDYLFSHAPQQNMTTSTSSKKNPAKYIFIFLGLILLGYVVYLFAQWYNERNIEQKIYVQTGEQISIGTKNDNVILEGQITSLQKLATINNIIKHDYPDTKIQNNLSLSLNALDKRLTSIDTIGVGSLKRIKENLILLEHSFETSINSINDKVLTLSHAVQKNQDTLVAIMKQKNAEILKLHEKQHTLQKLIVIKNEIEEKLDDTLGDNPFYRQKTHTLDFRNLHIFNANDAVYRKEAIDSVAKVFEVYINVLIPYQSYLKEIKIEGHTDSSGREADNIQLSQKRAYSIREYLIQLDTVKIHHIASLIRVYGYGSAQKIVYHGVEDKNASRRITIRFELNNVKILHKIGELIHD